MKGIKGVWGKWVMCDTTNPFCSIIPNNTQAGITDTDTTFYFLFLKLFSSLVWEPHIICIFCKSMFLLGSMKVFSVFCIQNRKIKSRLKAYIWFFLWSTWISVQFSFCKGPLSVFHFRLVKIQGHSHTWLDMEREVVPITQVYLDNPVIASYLW